MHVRMATHSSKAREVVVQVRMHAEEQDIVARAATREGLALSTFMRAVAMTRARAVVDGRRRAGTRTGTRSSAPTRRRTKR